MRKMVRGSLTEEQQNCWMKACRRKYIEWGAAGIGALALFLFSSGYCPIICSIGSRHSSFACHRTIGRVSAASGGSGTSVRRFPHSILLLRRGWSGHNGCRAVALGSGGVSFVGSVHGTLGVGSYGVGGGLGGRKAMRIELSAFRHNRFNRYRRCFVVVS